jgi:hypothetical protein
MAPLVEQVVVEPPPVEGADDGLAGVPVPGEAGTVGFAGVGAAVTVTSVVEVWAGAPATLEAPGAKTPPGLAGVAADADGLGATGD